MPKEQDSLDAHDVIEHVHRPRGHKVIPVHWICSVKVNGFEHIITFKARLVSSGLKAGSRDRSG